MYAGIFLQHPPLPPPSLSVSRLLSRVWSSPIWTREQHKAWWSPLGWTLDTTGGRGSMPARGNTPICDTIDLPCSLNPWLPSSIRNSLLSPVIWCLLVDYTPDLVRGCIPHHREGIEFPPRSDNASPSGLLLGKRSSALFMLARQRARWPQEGKASTWSQRD